MSSRQAGFHKDNNFRLMSLLQDNPRLTQREQANALGISFGGLNYCLNALIAKGFVMVQNFSQNKNKLGYVYLLTPAGIAEKTALTSSFLKRKLDEYEALRVEIKDLKLKLKSPAHDIASEATVVIGSEVTDVIASAARQSIS